MIRKFKSQFSRKKVITDEKNYIKKKLENPDADGKKILAGSEGLYLYKVSYE